MGTFSRALHDQVLLGIRSACQGSRVSRVETGSHESYVYMAKFIELARFKDDYVATYMAKVRKFEDGLKLSIRGKIVGFLLQDMDSMVRTTMAIEREIDDALSIRDASASEKMKESHYYSSSGKKRRTSVP